MACEQCIIEISNLEYGLAKTESLLLTEKYKNKLLLYELEKFAAHAEAPHWVRDDAARALRTVAEL